MKYFWFALVFCVVSCSGVYAQQCRNGVCYAPSRVPQVSVRQNIQPGTPVVYGSKSAHQRLRLTSRLRQRVASVGGFLLGR